VLGVTLGAMLLGASMEFTSTSLKSPEWRDFILPISDTFWLCADPLMSLKMLEVTLDALERDFFFMRVSGFK
jgi:hypothetical protein